MSTYRCHKGHPPDRYRETTAGYHRCLECDNASNRRTRKARREARAAARKAPGGDGDRPTSAQDPAQRQAGNAGANPARAPRPGEPATISATIPPPPPDDVEIVEELTDDTIETEPVCVEGATSSFESPKEEPAPSGARVQHPPPGGLPVDELIEHRIRRYAAKAAHEAARALIPIRLADNLPIGILHFGDPHLDDDGVDLGLVRAHVEIVRATPGLYAANVGDTTNNWIGRLAALYGSQATTESEAWQLCEWFIRSVGPRWLYILGGNHDLWSGAGDPLQWITRSAGALYQGTEARVELQFPGGARVRINARHDFPGRSIYNDAHGPMRWLIFNQRDHLAVGGHIHVSAHATLKASDSGITMHALRVASYKRHDEYARTGGFPDKHLSPCALTVIDPGKPDQHPDLVKVFWDPAEGADYLTHLRSRAKGRAP